MALPEGRRNPGPPVNDGGPAFPTQREVGAGGEYSIEYVDGMTMRDYFAAAALKSRLMERALAETPKPEGFTVGQHVAQIAYTIADRMLQERSHAASRDELIDAMERHGAILEKQRDELFAALSRLLAGAGDAELGPHNARLYVKIADLDAARSTLDKVANG